MNSNKPSVQQNRRFIPVVKTPRQEWDIPRIDAYARLLEDQHEEERRKALCEGTTPQGREILRKIIFRAQRMLTEEDCSIQQIVDAIEGQLRTFEVLRPEFALLLSRLWGASSKIWCEVPTREFAVIMVIGLKLEIALVERSKENTPPSAQACRSVP